jgi:hypothetical protein
MFKFMKSTFTTISIWVGLFVLALFGGAIFGAPMAATKSTAGTFAGFGLAFAAFGTIDMFDSRTMLQALEQMLIPNTAILNLFFKIRNTFATLAVDVDIIKGKRKLAPFVSPLAQGKLMERLGYEARSIKPPYIKPKMVTTAADILKRLPGETIYQGNMDPATRAQMQLGKDLLYLVNTIKRREEWMAAQALTTGQLIAKGEGVDVLIDFLMASSHKVTLTGNALWSDYTNSDPVQNIADWRDMLAQDSGLAGDTILLGSDARKNFVSNTNVQKKLDKTKIALGQIDLKALPDGLIYYGNVELVDVYGYNEWYVDDTDGTTKPMIPADRIVMGSTKARAERLYGAIQDLKAGTNAAVDYFPKSWEEEDPSARMLLVQSAPIPAPLQIDAFMTAKVV